MPPALSACGTSPESGDSKLDVGTVPAQYRVGCPPVESFVTPDMTPADANGPLAHEYGKCRRLQKAGTDWTVRYLEDIAGRATSTTPSTSFKPAGARQ